MAYTVKAVAEMAGVSVRTLHHYDQIGLLKPSSQSAAGYRLYEENDLQRLQQVLFFKELGFALKEIKRILSDPKFDRRRALTEHRGLLLQRQEQIGRLIQSVDRTLKSMKRGTPMNAGMFDGFDPAQYEEEARQRWGHTTAWQESQRRTKAYTKQDWAEIQRESGQIMERIVAVMERGAADPQVQQCIAAHHRQINQRFYACSAEVYRGLGDLYVQDSRFTAYFEKFKPGLATFMREAMNAYCDSLGKSSEPGPARGA